MVIPKGRSGVTQAATLRALLGKDGCLTLPGVFDGISALFGLGMSAKVAFGVMHGLVPMTLFTLGAVRGLPPVLIRTARVLRLSQTRTMLWVLLPACLPDVINGLRISFSLTYARRPDRRDVLLAARPRLPAGQRHGAAQCPVVDRRGPDHHGRVDCRKHADAAPGSPHLASGQVICKQQ
jgi:hypothetical protein